MPVPVVEEEQIPIPVKEEEKDEVIVEDVKEDEHEDDDEDDDDDDDEEDDTTLTSAEGIKQSRSEKKSRKAMLKLGLKPVSGVSRVTIKRAKNVRISPHETYCFFISKPDVFKSPYSETYVIFGEAKIEDLSSQLQTQAAQQFRLPDMSSMMANSEASAASAAAQEEEEEIDDTGVEPRDIELVMTQAGVSKGKAVNALKAHDGDIVGAIMELTA
ncbi:nascent polypeptide-associated complex subunit alpha-like protein 5 [Chenopodium quinoa]|uniref:nascent polypeptide-associated complex subunit alpha-like protein 5 n=1 Tax=Chenopodium quinoa TaxID=63459 RepID=UPI000B77FA88|nr:nascent polypeptide-associated complex subunit alpha-like protein 5 [Chenopodium quinoa]